MANIKNRKKLQLIQTIWDVMLYSQHFTFHWKLLGLVSRIEKSGTGDNNFGKWKGTFRSDRPKWPDRSQWTTFKAGPEYSGRTKPKWSVPFDEPTEISGLLGWMESALYYTRNFITFRVIYDIWGLNSTTHGSTTHSSKCGILLHAVAIEITYNLRQYKESSIKFRQSLRPKLLPRFS